MRTYLVLTILCFISTVVFAEDVYIAQTMSGSDTGADCSNAHSMTWFNTAGNWGGGVGEIDPGDTVHLCGTITTTATIQASGTAGNVITLLAESGAKFSKSYWGTTTGSAIYLSGKNYITIDGGADGIIENTDNGTELGNQQDSNGIYITGSNNIIVRNWSIQNLYLIVPSVGGGDSHAYGKAIIGIDTSSLEIGNNVISYAFYGVYTYAMSGNRDDLKIHHNTISQCSTGIVSALAGAVNYTGVEIYNNTLSDWAPWGGCWGTCTDSTMWHHEDGIHLWGNYPSNHLEATIYNNIIGGDITSHMTGNIFIENHIYPVTIYNNILYSSTTDHPAQGYIDLAHNSTSSNSKIYNNTIRGAGTTSSGGVGIHLRGSSSGVVDIANNIISTCYIGIWHDNSSTLTSDYNVLHNLGSTAIMGSWYSTLGNWQTALGGCPNAGNECNSINTNPLFISSSNFNLQSSSPAINSGVDLTAYFTTDLLGNIRLGTWDIGAYEYAGAVNGLCGSNDGGSFTSLTSGNANNCSIGTATNFTGSGPWTWTCAGSDGGTDDSCSANLFVPRISGVRFNGGVRLQ